MKCRLTIDPKDLYQIFQKKKNFLNFYIEDKNKQRKVYIKGNKEIYTSNNITTSKKTEAHHLINRIV